MCSEYCVRMSRQLFSKCVPLQCSLLREKLIRSTSYLPAWSVSLPRRQYSLYEPDYLESLKPKIPLYGPLNVQIKGYNFAILENYQKLVHKIAVSMDVEVEEGWATPPKHLQIQKYKPNSTVVDTEYKLSVFERNIQLIDLPSTVASILFEAFQTALPEGVSLRIQNHEDDHEEVRYIPDHELLDLKSQLDTLGGPTTKKK